jgi:hypothetical protein
MAVGAATGQELYEAALSGHRQAFESIASIDAHVRTQTTFKSKNGEPQTNQREGEWRQSGVKVRWNERYLNPNARARGGKKAGGAGPPRDVKREEETDGAVVDGLLTTIKSRRQSDGYADKFGFLELASKGQPAFIDLWSRAGFLVQESPRLSLLDVLEHREWVKRIEHAELDGLKCLHVFASPDKLNVEAWLSVSHGFLVRRMLVSHRAFTREDSYLEYETDSFQEHANHVFFPLHTAMRIYLRGDEAGKPSGGITDAFFDVKSINEPIPDDTFRLTIPEGTRTVDRRSGTTFVMGIQGKASESEPIQPIRVMPEPQAAVVSGYNLWNWMTLSAVLGVVLGAAVIWRVFSRRSLRWFSMQRESGS